MGESEQGRTEGKTLALREQARRYNDLRVAYESLSRRLDKGRCVGGGTVVKGGGRGGQSEASKRCGPVSQNRRIKSQVALEGDASPQVTIGAAR